MVDTNFILEIIKAIFSWPTVIILFGIFFFRDIKKLFEVITNKSSSFKTGNFEFSLNDLPKHTDDRKPASEVLLIKQTENSKKIGKNIIKDAIKYKKLADLRLFLKTVSFQLISWLYMHKNGKPFSLNHLLKIEHIPQVYQGKITGYYCVHSMYEKEAIAAEFKRNYFNFKALGLIEDVDKENVRIIQDRNLLQLLENAMEEVSHIEGERDRILSFPDRVLLMDKTSRKKK